MIVTKFKARFKQHLNPFNSTIQLAVIGKEEKENVDSFKRYIEVYNGSVDTDTIEYFSEPMRKDGIISKFYDGDTRSPIENSYFMGGKL